jgi:hypothetical protein
MRLESRLSLAVIWGDIVAPRGRYGTGINLVGISNRPKSYPSQLAFGLVGVNMPSGLSLNSQACWS